jgi:hypothetical protein
MDGSRVDGASTRKEGVGLFAIARLQTILTSLVLVHVSHTYNIPTTLITIHVNDTLRP